MALSDPNEHGQQFLGHGRSLQTVDKIPNRREQRPCFSIAHGFAQCGKDYSHATGSGMLAEDETVLAANDRRVKSLIVVGMLEQAIDVHAGLVCESPFADNALLPWNRTTGGLRDELGYGRKALQIDARIDAITTAKPHHHFFKGCISGALAQAVDRGIDMRGASPDGGQRICRGETKVVMRMHLDLQIRPATQLSDAISHRKGIQNTQGVGETESTGTGLLPHFGNPCQKIRIGTRRILGTNANVDSAVTRNRNMPTQVIKQPCAIPAQLVRQMLVG